MTLRKLVVAILISGNLANANVTTILDVSSKVPNQLVGNCSENNGKGSYTKQDGYNSASKYLIEYKCTVPIINISDVPLAYQYDPSIALQIDRPVKTYEDSAHTLSGYVYPTTFDLVLVAKCGDPCTLAKLKKALLNLGNFQGQLVTLSSISSDSTSDTNTVCTEYGPYLGAYTDNCIKRVPADSAGNYCAKTEYQSGGYLVCTEYKNVNPEPTSGG